MIYMQIGENTQATSPNFGFAIADVVIMASKEVKFSQSPLKKVQLASHHLNKASAIASPK